MRPSCMVTRTIVARGPCLPVPHAVHGRAGRGSRKAQAFRSSSRLHIFLGDYSRSASAGPWGKDTAADVRPGNARLSVAAGPPAGRLTVGRRLWYGVNGTTPDSSARKPPRSASSSSPVTPSARASQWGPGGEKCGAWASGLLAGVRSVRSQRIGNVASVGGWFPGCTRRCAARHAALFAAQTLALAPASRERRWLSWHWSA